jgi:transcriptional regulator with XRE-family HTH domain
LSIAIPLFLHVENSRAFALQLLQGIGGSSLTSEVIAFRRDGLDCRHGCAKPELADIPAGHFSSLLKHWRSVRRLTQIELAVDANVSAKHLCFLETGRSQPSREMVQLLCSALDLPLEERNALHVAAGFVPPYGDKGLAAENLQPVRQALDFILRQQEPYPGIVIDGHWDVRIRNQGSARLLKPFRDSYEMENGLADNAMHVVFHPKGLRQFMVELGRVRPAVDPDPASRCRARQPGGGAIARGNHGLSRTVGRMAAATPFAGVLAGHDDATRKGDYRLAFFSTFTTLAMPTDAALQQIKIECFFPADDATAEKARQWHFDQTQEIENATCPA